MFHSNESVRDATHDSSSAVTHRAAVVIMAKAPREGETKTRLSPPFAPADCAALAACMFKDAAASALGVAPHLFVAFAPADGRATLEPLLPNIANVHWLEQSGADLGRRLRAVVSDLFAHGFGPVAIIGADSPTLPSHYISRALEALACGAADVALGPTDDGGYYLAALRRDEPRLFERIEWSTPRAFEQTARNAAHLSLRLLELPRWYDVDTPADLARLRAELLTDEDARRRAPATFEWMRASEHRLFG